jgi:galactose mutarotase-like enzyme
MIKKLENDFLTVEINQTGAELFSIKSKKTGIEYVWQGDAKYWKGKAPLLFPICGRLFGGKYTYKGAEYQMQLHGFARNVDFSSKVISNEVIEFELNSSEESKKQYPFDFNLVVRYTLKDTALKTEFIVKNTGKEDLYFSCGGHPGFNVPFTDGEKFEDYYIEFGKNELSRLIFSETCFCTGKAEKYPLTDNKLALKHDLFDNDALFFETNTETEKVTLKNKNNNNAVEMSYGDMTCLGIWHMPKTDAPYVCIEPWHGVPSTDGIVDDFETKQQLIKLGENKTYDNFFTIKIVED